MPQLRILWVKGAQNVTEVSLRVTFLGLGFIARRSEKRYLIDIKYLLFEDKRLA